MSTEWLPLGLAVGGVLLAFPNARTTLRLALNTQLYLATVRRLVDAGNYARLRKLVTALPRAELLVLTRRWLALDLPAVVHAPSAVGYREPSEVVSLEERARDALGPYVAQRRARYALRFPSSVAGAGLAVAAIVLSPEGWVFAIAALAELFALYGGVGVWRLRRDLGVALDTLVTLPPPSAA